MLHHYHDVVIIKIGTILICVNNNLHVVSGIQEVQIYPSVVVVYEIFGLFSCNIFDSEKSSDQFFK